MVFVDLEGLIAEVKDDSFAALAANILLGLNLSYQSDQVESDLAGKVMLSIYNRDKDLFLKCSEIILKRNLSDDNDEWVYNEYLALFTVKGANIWSEGRDAAERIIAYRIERSSDDSRAVELMEALNRKSEDTVISLAVNNTTQPLNQSICSEQVNGWLERGIKLPAIDRILIAATQKQLLDGLLLEEPAERQAARLAIKRLFTHCKTHAIIEFSLLCTASVLAAVLFILAYLTGTNALKTFLGDLMAIASFGPVGLIIVLIGLRTKYINARTRSIFKRIAAYPPQSFSNTLEI